MSASDNGIHLVGHRLLCTVRRIGVCRWYVCTYVYKEHVATEDVGLGLYVGSSSQAGQGRAAEGGWPAPSLSTISIVLCMALATVLQVLPDNGYQVPRCTTPGHTTVHCTQYQSYVLQYITYVVRTRSTYYHRLNHRTSDVYRLPMPSAIGLSLKKHADTHHTG